MENQIASIKSKGQIWTNHIQDEDLSNSFKLSTKLSSNVVVNRNVESYDKYYERPKFNKRYKRKTDVKVEKFNKRISKGTKSSKIKCKNAVELANKFALGKPFRLNTYGPLKETQSDADFNAELCYRLRESNKDLLSSLVQLIGKKLAINLYEKTKEIELKGGLPAFKRLVKEESQASQDQNSSNDQKSEPLNDNTASKDKSTTAKITSDQSKKPTRRKTPGGVFLHLLYEDTRIDQSEVAKIRTKFLKEQKKRCREYKRKNQKKVDDKNLIQESQMDVRNENSEMEDGECSD